MAAKRLRVLLQQLDAEGAELQHVILQAPVQAPAAEEHALPTGTSATVCVTGAAGFVGSWLVKLALERGHTVRACVRNVEDDRKAGFLKAMPEFKTGRLTVHSADMTKEGSYDDIFKGVHTVFHPAEVFMSFGDGRNKQKAGQDFQEFKKEVTLDTLHEAATLSSRYLVDSINKSGTVRRLVYTASIASMMTLTMEELKANPAVDERREVNPIFGMTNYGMTKRMNEKLFAKAAAKSNGMWSMFTGNPSDIVGPVLSPHQATETWQGKMALVVSGERPPQEAGGRPWMTVDVRDVAEAELRLAESTWIASGMRFLLTAGDRILPEDLGVRIMELYPELDCPTTLADKPKVRRNLPVWMRVHGRTDRIEQATGMKWHAWDDTLRATVDSLISIGGVKPKLKSK